MKGRSWFSLTIVIGLGFSSLQVANSGERGSSITAMQSSYGQNVVETSETGTQAFKAIYFGAGPEAPKLQKNLNINQYLANSLKLKHFELVEDEHYQNQVNNVVDELAKKDPSYFATFGKNIQSKDPKKVEQTIDSGFNYLDEKINEKSNNVAVDGRANPAFLVALVAAAVWALVVWDAAAAVNYAVAVNVEGHVNVHQKTNFSVSKWGRSNQSILNGESGSIPKERAVTAVLETFSNGK